MHNAIDFDFDFVAFSYCRIESTLRSFVRFTRNEMQRAAAKAHRLTPLQYRMPFGFVCVIFFFYFRRETMELTFFKTSPSCATTTKSILNNQTNERILMHFRKYRCKSGLERAKVRRYAAAQIEPTRQPFGHMSHIKDDFDVQISMI